jgi:hypothetical protein
VAPDVDARLSEAIARGRKLVDDGRGLRSQRDYVRWKQDVVEWRTSIAETLEAGFATANARDALLGVWSFNAPVCTIWTDSLKVEREVLSVALQLAERIHDSTAAHIA